MVDIPNFSFLMGQQQQQPNLVDSFMKGQKMAEMRTQNRLLSMKEQEMKDEQSRMQDFKTFQQSLLQSQMSQGQDQGQQPQPPQQPQQQQPPQMPQRPPQPQGAAPQMPQGQAMPQQAPPMRPQQPQMQQQPMDMETYKAQMQKTFDSPAFKLWESKHPLDAKQYKEEKLDPDLPEKATPEQLYVIAQTSKNPVLREKAAKVIQAQMKDKLTEKRTAEGTTIQQVKDIGDAIMRGEQSPVISGFGMAKIAAPLKAYLAHQGYDLRSAELDYKATEKHLATLNGAQQTKLRQAIEFSSDSLGLVEELAKKWQGGKFPPLNKANLSLAKNGAMGPQAQQIATQLDTQISDLTSELGTVYKGGNSSTDESLKLAAKNLSADWSMPQLLSNIQLVRKNLAIRKNSILTTGVAGLSTEDKTEKPSSGGAPTIGTVEGGYKFKGGDPSKQENWEKQ